MTTVVTSPARPAGTVRTLLATGWLCVASVSSAETVRVVEFAYDGLVANGTQFLTADANEIHVLDSGTIAGWQRTGFEFMAYATPGADRVPMCRFYSDRFGIEVRHFYTAFPEECEALKSSGDWTYEGHVFYVPVPDTNGACTAGTVPMYRGYRVRQRYIFGEPGEPHVLVLDPQHRLAPVRPPEGSYDGEGTWSTEGPAGIAFCVPASFDLARSRLTALATGTWEFRIEGGDVPWQVLDWPLRLSFGFVAETAGFYDEHEVTMTGQWGNLPVRGTARWAPLEGKVSIDVYWADERSFALSFPYAGGASIRGSAFANLGCSLELCPQWSEPFVLVGERQ